MSAFIPDQLDEMSKKELLKVAKIMHEENVKLKAEKKKYLLTTLADCVLEVLRNENIENFSTNALSTNEGRQVELTIRYVDGQTPADKLNQQQGEIDQLKERCAELESCIIKFRKAVTHFNRTRGDLNPLLTAYADCELIRLEKRNDGH